MDCLTDATKSNKVLNIGGPDDGLTMTDQGKLVSEAIFSKRIWGDLAAGSLCLYKTPLVSCFLVHDVLITGSGYKSRQYTG